MAIIFRRHTIDVLLLVFFLIVSLIFIRRYTSKLYHGQDTSLNDQELIEQILPERLNPAPDRTPLAVSGGSNPKEVDPRVLELSDVRSAHCKRKSDLTRRSVTVILDFSDYQFFDVKNTLSSLEVTKSWDLIEEVLLVDDASSLEYIKDDVTKFLPNLPKVRLLKGNYIEPLGQARARALAARQAKTDVIVFIDSKTLVTRGWLEPLIDLLEKDSKAVAVPHFDLIKDPVSLSYEVTSDKTVASFSWNLSIRMKETISDQEPSGNNEEDGTNDDVSNDHGSALEYKSPVMRGNVFAVRKEFLDSIGGYDETLEDIGGEHLELSLRIWLCGGKIVVLTCSRVGILNLNDPIKVTSQKNVIRIAELWFGDRKSIVYRSSSISNGLRKLSENDDLKESVKKRKNTIVSNNQCKSMDWYLQNIATSIVTPSQDAVKFGILKVKTGRCSRLLSTMRIKLDDCKPEHFNRHPPEMIFELNKDGQIKVMDKCLTVKNNAYVLAETCRAGDNKQQWKYLAEQLINMWSTYCAMHVTDPDKDTEGDRQIAMAQDCGSDQGNIAFKKWEFVAV